MSAATLLNFARANDAAAGTTKKLQKQAALADYFKNLSDPDLRLAVRYAAGRAFPATAETVLNVGSATVWAVALGLLGVPHEELRTTVIRAGEIGEALATLWHTPLSGTQRVPADPLTLHDLSAAFDSLASTGNVERKRETLHDLFSRCAAPREAAYLAKIIFRDMRTGVQEGVLQAAIAEAFEKELKEIQRTQLLVGDLEEVAILAKRDALSAAKFTLFHPIQFMLATPQETPADAAATLDDRPYFCEDKLDGIRAQVHKSAGKVYIYTRTMDRTDASFPDVVDALRRLPGDFLLDGEIVPYAHGHVLPFAHIQRRLGRKVLTRKILADNPCRFIAFDLLYLDGQLLMDLPLQDRRRALDSLCLACAQLHHGHATPPPPQSAFRIPHSAIEDPALLTTQVSPVTTEDDITRAFSASRTRRNEGIVLKDPASPYSPGRRGKSWLKLKTHLPTFDCVVTAAEYGHGKRRHVLSDYTFAVWDRDPTDDPAATLVNVGKAYTGLTDAEIADLTQTFLSLSLANNGRVHQVQPRIVLEIACDQIQRSSRHASGYALRFPRIKRIRTDKRPKDADRLSRIAEIYESQANFAKSAHPPAKATPDQPTLFDHL